MFKSYASYFVSYLLANLKSMEEINNIILFGSVTKEEATKESDVDIFVELKKENRKLKKEIEKSVEEFYKSREALLFKTKGIDNKINLIIGKFDKWNELKKSIESTGIILYGKYHGGKIEGKKYLIIFWDNIKKNRGAFLNKIYGFRVKEKSYKGLIEILAGKKLGKSSMMIPVEHKKEIETLLEKYKVNAKVIEIWH